MMTRSRMVLLLLLTLGGTGARAADSPRGLTLADGRFGKALDARSSPATIDGSPRFGQAPLTVECWARLFGKKGFNVLISCDAKSSSSHWEIYTCAKTGEFSAYLPAVEPTEVRSGIDICDGKWHYLAMTFDGKTVRLFVDGKQAVERAVEKRAVSKAVTGALTVGAAVDGKQVIGCDGLVDEVRLSGTLRDLKGVPDEPLPFDPKTMLLHRFDRLDDLVVDPAWTPPPVTGNVPDWLKATDKDWVDARFRVMDTGPFLDATFEYPTWRGAVRSFKGTAIRLGDEGQAAVLFDRNQLRLAAGWTGGYLQHSQRRFALLNTPRPAGEVCFATALGPGWTNPKNEWGEPEPATAPLPREWAKYRGLYLHGNRVVLSYTVGSTAVLDSPWAETSNGLTAFTRTLEIAPSQRPLRLLVCELPAAGSTITEDGVSLIAATHEKEATAVTLVGAKALTLEVTQQKRVELAIPPHAETLRLKLLLWNGPPADRARFAALAKARAVPGALAPLTKPGPARWTAPIVTRGVVAKDDGPFAIDTLTMPYDNLHKALLFAGGIDFLPSGELAVCTAHGDVWLVRGVDDKLERLTWKRFATGLYQPLGLKVVDGKVVVLERGQLTRLHDRNDDGEADFYENLNNDWHTGGGEHSFDTCLETDPEGNFYFFKTGDTHTPSGGCLYRVSKDGSKSEVFATGFRHPIGLSVSPTGVVTGADQEGNYMPATRLDQYRKGGFYGDLRAHHRPTPPKTYDPPLCWLPHEMDNSAGGQVWVPPDRFGPLGGQMLHLSYGRCKAMLVLRQEIDGQWQGGAVDLGWNFLSGAMRARFNPRDGHLYVVGMTGWQTAAQRDGCLQRVRYTGQKVYLPSALEAQADGIRLTFTQPLDRRKAEDVSRYRIGQWNYRWSAEYGSKRWSVANPEKIGADVVPVKAARLLEDGRSVFLTIDRMRPVMQMELKYDVAAADGKAIAGVVYHTIHRPAPASGGR